MNKRNECEIAVLGRGFVGPPLNTRYRVFDAEEIADKILVAYLHGKRREKSSETIREKCKIETIMNEWRSVLLGITFFPKSRFSMRHILFFCLLTLFCAVSGVAEGQWTQFLTKVAKADKINALISEGNKIWCATDAGIVQWNASDGTYDLHALHGMQSLNCVAIDWNGVKWFGSSEAAPYQGTNALVFSFKDSVLISFSKEDSDVFDKPFSSVKSIIADYMNKRIICAVYWNSQSDRSYYSLIAYNGNSWEELISFSQSFGLMPFETDTINPWNIWGGGLGDYLYLFQKGIQGYESEQIPLKMNDSGIRSIAIDYNNCIWITTLNNIYSYDRTNLTKYSSDITGSIGRVWNLVIDRNNVKWIASDGALIRYNGEIWDTFPFEPQSEQDQVTALAVDEHGDVWMGRTTGLWRFRPAETRVDEEIGMPKAITITGNSPNPFNPSTTISFSLPAPGHASLAVYDITGRKVRTLVSGLMSSGEHAVTWDGRDEAGQPVASGVYISRLTAGKHVATEKMALVR